MERRRGGEEEGGREGEGGTSVDEWMRGHGNGMRLVDGAGALMDGRKKEGKGAAHGGLEGAVLFWRERHTQRQRGQGCLGADRCHAPNRRWPTLYN